MAKSADPVQAARKAAVKREAKRNRERRSQAQEARLLRQDTRSLERQIERLESRQGSLSEEDQEALKRLQAEVASVKRIKEEYLRKHPDQRNFVRGYEEAGGSSSSAKASHGNGSSSSEPQQAASSKQGPAPPTTAKDPRRSIYYDAVFNPYGAPPPGMPYLEKPYAQLVNEGLIDATKPPPLPEETADFQDEEDSDDSSIDEDLKEIIMPSGPPPIRLLPDSADPRAFKGVSRGSSQPTRGTSRAHGLARGGRGRGSAHQHPQAPRQGPQHTRGGHTGQPRIHQGLPPRPPPMGPSDQSPAQIGAAQASAQTPRPPPRPPGPPGPPPAIPDGVVISAEPQLRDFKKESTAFVPAAIRKKQQEEKSRMKRGLPGRVDAAPISEGTTQSNSASNRDKPDLLKSVQAHLPSKRAGSTSQDGGQAGAKKNDYDRFLDEVGDLL